MDGHTHEVILRANTSTFFNGSLYLGRDPAPIGTTVSPSIEAALSSIEGSYDYVRTFQENGWRTYSPDHPEISDLDVMLPGQGYLIKMNQADTLDYCE